MCLGIPGKILETYKTDNLLMGKVDFGGAVRETCLEYVPEAQVDDFVIVHVGFAINIVSEQEAQETLALISEIMDVEEELGPEKEES
jgi:hydrogenase expression/formation protein HypC